MSETRKEPSMIVEHPESVTQLADGTVQYETTLLGTSDVSPEQAREAFAEVHGVDIDNVEIRSHNGEPYDGTSRSKRVGRKSVAFSSSRWRASWDPHADPTQN